MPRQERDTGFAHVVREMARHVGVVFLVGATVATVASQITPDELLPLLPAKQRVTHPNDWMTTDAEVACPDPHCGARFRITRTGLRTFRHSEVTAVPLPDAGAST